MRIRTVWAALGLLVLMAPGVDAGDKLPKPVDSPVVRPNVKDNHKPGNLQRHPKKYQRVTWGANWNQIFRPLPQRVSHHLKF